LPAAFVNVGLGTSVDAAALFKALKDEQIGGAVLDVLAKEPLPEDSNL
jgi:glyoxylate/hydroxypyruvate reductase A